jgi:dTDP-glucose pyrophosphorylase
VQAVARGTADAIVSARAFIGNDTFLVANSDNYYPGPILRALRHAPAPALPGFSRAGLLADGQIPQDRIARYALLDVRPDGTLERILEKPDPATLASRGEALVSMNCWSFTPEIVVACERVPVSLRGEVELPLAVQWAIDNLSMRFTVFPVEAPVLDLSHRADIPGVERRLGSADVRL